MQLSDLQLATQELIIQKIHWCSLEEARKLEIWNWCICYHTYLKEYQTILEVIDDKNLRIKWYDLFTQPDEIEVFWLPPTLPRVLDALGDDYYYELYGIQRRVPLYWIETDILRKLLNEDRTDATLRDQSQETQEKIYSLLQNK